MNCNFKLYNYDQKTCKDAISRLHGSGSAVPKKVTGKYIYVLEEIAKQQNRTYGNKILIIADYGAGNDIETLLSQLKDLRYGIGTPNQISNNIDVAPGITIKVDEDELDANGNIVYANNIFQDFRTNVGYDTTKINLTKYVDSENIKRYQTLANTTVNANENPDGQIIISYISSLLLDNNGSPVAYYYYDGSDLTIDNYTLVIMFTKILPMQFDNNNYGAPFDKHTVDVTEYSPLLGYNLQKYINSGGNVIFGNNVWNTLTNIGGIPNFSYQGIPFLQNTNYKYANSDYAVNKIKLLLPGHPILKNCSNALLLQTQPGMPKPDGTAPRFSETVVTNIIPSVDATVIATIEDTLCAGTPFVAVNVNRNGGRTVGINTYLASVSTNNKNGNRELAKIIFNAIYWCFKINN